MKKETLSLAACIALFPPLWAVAAPYIGITTGAVALICAGLYVANGNRLRDAVKISTGFLLGAAWAWLALRIMAAVELNPNVELFCTLFVLGALAVLISAALEKWIFCPAWLCGWAIGLTVMTMVQSEEINSYFLQIAAAMLVGVWYVGAFLNWIQQKLLKLWQSRAKQQNE